MSIESPVMTPTAGDNHTIICSVETVEHLIVKPTLKWVLISNDLANVSEYKVNSSTLALAFNPLFTSYAGAYSCEATINIPEAGVVNLTQAVRTNVVIRSKSTVVMIAQFLSLYHASFFSSSTCNINS